MIHAVILKKFFFHFSPVNRTFRLIEFRIIELLLYMLCIEHSFFMEKCLISILNNSLKLLDKRLESFLKKHNILSENQYGFQHGKSTEFVKSEIMEKISAAIDNKMSTIRVFIDFMKAFDTINHSILIDKLEHYGVRGTATKWIMTYLSGRQ